jgi:Sporulation and spore germination
MRNDRGVRTLLGLVLLTTAVSACSISTEGTPRVIAERDRQDLRINVDPSGGAAVGSGRIYLLAPEVTGEARTLQSVARDVVDTPIAVLGSLFEGPNSDELQALLRSAIPPGTHLLNSTQNDSQLTLNVSSELQQLTGEALIDGVAQIVLTASEINGVSSVFIAIDGVNQQWPAANGELQSDALTRFDFPGLVASSQPAFPSVPSPPAG